MPTLINPKTAVIVSSIVLNPATQRLPTNANRTAQSKGFWLRGGLPAVLMISGNTAAGWHWSVSEGRASPSEPRHASRKGFGRRRAQRFKDIAEIVVRDVQRGRRNVMIKLPAEAVGQAREAAVAHAWREILPLNAGSRDILLRIARYDAPYDWGI